MIDAVPPVRGRVGRPLRRPRSLVADRGYDADDACRRPLRARHVTPLIARRREPHGSGLGLWRYVVEQGIALLHQFRRLRTRFDKRDDVHESFIDLAICMICWRRLNGGYF
jgi:hypothetical protein